MGINKEEANAFSRGFLHGMNLVNGIYEQTFKKNYLVRKWIWWTFLISSFTADGLLFWHLLKDHV